MKRLVDEMSADDPNRALVEAQQKADADPFMQTRVLARMRSAEGGVHSVPRGRWRPAGVLVTLVVLALASAASAMIWRAVKHRSTPSPVVTNAPNAPAQHLELPDPTPNPIAQPVEAPRVDTRPAPKHTHPTRIDPEPEGKAAAPTDESEVAESQLLLDAYRALRAAHDAPLALRNLDAYLKLYPRGKLTEEALTLALEASAHDSAAASRYARHYLARFPDGSKAALCTEILQRLDEKPKE